METFLSISKETNSCKVTKSILFSRLNMFNRVKWNENGESFVLKLQTNWTNSVWISVAVQVYVDRLQYRHWDWSFISAVKWLTVVNIFSISHTQQTISGHTLIWTLTSTLLSVTQPVTLWWSDWASPRFLLHRDQDSGSDQTASWRYAFERFSQK